MNICASNTQWIVLNRSSHKSCLRARFAKQHPLQTVDFLGFDCSSYVPCSRGAKRPASRIRRLVRVHVTHGEWIIENGKNRSVKRMMRNNDLRDLRRVGLARALSKLGYCSRSQASALIRAGRVRLNGALRRDPETPVLMGTDRIELDSRLVGEETKIYLMLNKPRGLVTTASDEQGRETIYACLKEALPWLAPVGRLDKASEGLLLLTNDSDWAAQIVAPETHLAKTYHVQVSGVMDAAVAEALVKGVRVEGLGLLRAKERGDPPAGRPQYLAIHRSRRGKEPADPAHAGNIRDSSAAADPGGDWTARAWRSAKRRLPPAYR